MSEYQTSLALGLGRPAEDLASSAQIERTELPVLRTQQRAEHTRRLARLLASLSTKASWADWQAGLAKSGFVLREAWAHLPSAVQKEIRAHLDEASLQEIFSLAQESHPRLFASDWLGFALRQEESRKFDIAASVYAALLAA